MKPAEEKAPPTPSEAAEAQGEAAERKPRRIGKIYGYARCSTTEKRQDVERQVAELYAQGAEVVIQEYGSGADVSRAGYKELMEALAPGDTLSATELSRITRDLHQLCHVMEEARSRRLKLRFGGHQYDCREGSPGAYSKAMLYLMGVFAELERDMTAERIASGLAKARSEGQRLGRPKKTAEEVPAGFRGNWEATKRGELTMVELAERTGVSRPSAYKYSGLLEREQEQRMESRRTDVREGSEAEPKRSGSGSEAER